MTHHFLDKFIVPLQVFLDPRVLMMAKYAYSQLRLVHQTLPFLDSRSKVLAIQNLVTYRLSYCDGYKWLRDYKYVIETCARNCSILWYLCVGANRKIFYCFGGATVSAS